MTSSPRRRVFSFVVCVRDDDVKTFELRTLNDGTSTASAVAAAVAKGRRVRCYTLAADPQATERERLYLTQKGYVESPIAL